MLKRDDSIKKDKYSQVVPQLITFSQYKPTSVTLLLQLMNCCHFFVNSLSSLGSAVLWKLSKSNHCEPQRCWGHCISFPSPSIHFQFITYFVNPSLSVCLVAQHNLCFICLPCFLPVPQFYFFLPFSHSFCSSNLTSHIHCLLSAFHSRLGSQKQTDLKLHIIFHWLWLTTFTIVESHPQSH